MYEDFNGNGEFTPFMGTGEELLNILEEDSARVGNGRRGRGGKGDDDEYFDGGRARGSDDRDFEGGSSKFDDDDLFLRKM